MKDNFEDIVGSIEEERQPTPEDAEVLWQKFCEINLRGRRIEFGSQGGDMYRIDATIEGVKLVQGKGVVVEVSNATTTQEGGTDKSPHPLDITKIILNQDQPPRFSNVGELIVLPTGANYIENAKGDSFTYGETLFLGFIY
ncbi:MAG: hypothetical protein Q7R94_03025 [bacterium]|nr:hypothetical protein [bacterium]